MLPIDILKLDHVAWAVWDLTGPVRILTDVLGARYCDGGDETAAGFRWLQFQLPHGKIEVIEPLRRDSFLSRFLDRRGPGLHHITFYVEDIERALEGLRQAGFEPVDVNLSHESWKEAFIHPRDAHGVLFQIAETAEPFGEPTPRRTLEEFLADRPGIRPG